MAYSRQVANTLLPIMATGDTLNQEDDAKRGLWSQQQYYEVLAHGDGIVSGGLVNASGQVTAGEWMVKGYDVTVAAATTPSGVTNGQRNYVAITPTGTAWWNRTVSVTAQIGSTAPAGGFIVASYDVSGGGAVSGIQDTPLRVFPTVMAEVTSPVLNVATLTQGTTLMVTMTHPAVSFRVSDTYAVINQTDLAGLDVFVDAARTIGTSAVLGLTNRNSTKIAGTAFTVVVTRTGIVRDPATAGFGGASITVGNK